MSITCPVEPARVIETWDTVEPEPNTTLESVKLIETEVTEGRPSALEIHVFWRPEGEMERVRQ